ncbi:C13 family peptidase [Paraprevotella xylaniphila]|uniref:C13 family peptidase n=1 Tax=Paraprevotella xylaniphila TaxID=454155 RepID=UPI0023F3238B|nr:C13 family peptidase [Paraprevotella xylaniphila]
MKLQSIKYGILALACGLCGACEDEPAVQGSGAEVKEYRVAVVMPGENQSRWERVVSWAMEDLEKAQRGLSRKVKLKVEWKDENAPDLEDYLKAVAADSDVAAVIGPYHSSSARMASACCGARRKTLILPTASSVELQRSCAGKDFLWALSESDIGQCEVMLTQALMDGAENVYLLSREDDYGQSFIDWFTFQAVELGLMSQGNYTYSTPEDMAVALDKINARFEDLRHDDVFQTLLFAPSRTEDAVWLDSLVRIHPEWKLRGINLICSDMVYAPTLAGRLTSGLNWGGMALAADPVSGFPTVYQVKYGDEPLNGESHLYDALVFLAYGLTALQWEPESGLNEALKRVVDGRAAYDGGWMADDMRLAFALLQSGVYPNLVGVTGSWDFDEEKYTSVLHSTYAHWSYTPEDGFHTWDYLSTDGSRRTSSTLAGWNWAASRMESFDENAIEPAYPSLRHNWCVLVAASEGWANYRHQADVYAMYQLMKRHGYDDDHIILVAEDDIAWNPKNLYPGVVRVHRDGGNVYDGIRIDYRLDDLKPEDLEAILAGEAGGRTPYVVTGDEHTNVFLFWSGHGVYNGLNWGEGYEMLRGQQLGKMIRKAYERGNYRKMFVALEACYGGSMAEACKGIPGVVFMTAANAGETSKADVQDYEMNIWLSNGFTRAFQETIDANPSISLRDLYYKLARNTVGSHVSVYNEALYGNIFRNTMSEYLRE